MVLGEFTWLMDEVTMLHLKLKYFQCYHESNVRVPLFTLGQTHHSLPKSPTGFMPSRSESSLEGLVVWQQEERTLKTDAVTSSHALNTLAPQAPQAHGGRHLPRRSLPSPRLRDNLHIETQDEGRTARSQAARCTLRGLSADSRRLQILV